MKSAVILFIVVVMLAAGVTGIAATQPSTVPPYVAALGAKIDMLNGKVGLIGADVLAIKGDVASLTADVSSIEAELSDGNITRMMVLSGGKTLARSEYWLPIDEVYPEVRHVSLTLACGPFETGDEVQLCYSVGETYMCEELMPTGDRATYEFNTDKWELGAQEYLSGTTFLHLSYAATVTYAP